MKIVVADVDSVGSDMDYSIYDELGEVSYYGDKIRVSVTQTGAEAYCLGTIAVKDLEGSVLDSRDYSPDDEDGKDERDEQHQRENRHECDQRHAVGAAGGLAFEKGLGAHDDDGRARNQRRHIHGGDNRHSRHFRHDGF